MELIKPVAEAMAITAYVHQCGTRPLNEEAPKIRVPALADTEELGFAAGGMLPRD